MVFDVEKIRNDFPMLKNNPDLIYLDNGATTLKPKCVIDAVTRYYEFETSNIHRGDYTISARVSQQYEDVRKKVAKFINAKKTQEIVFTSGATEALNMVAYAYRSILSEKDVVLTTLVEHASSLLPWFKTCEVTNAHLEYMQLEQSGAINMDVLKQQLKANVKVVVLASVSNVLGYPIDMKEVCRLAHEAGAIVVCDGAQAIPHMKLDVQELDVDFLAFSGHKMCAPTGIGVLYGKLELLNLLEPMELGGGSNARFNREGDIDMKKSPFKFESGTPAIEATLGLGAAIDYLNEVTMEAISQHEEELKKYCVERLKDLPQVTCYSAQSPTGLVTFNVDGVFSQDAASFLNSKNIAVRSGHHCAKVIHQVVSTNQTVRASFYFYNTFEEVDAFIEALKQVNLENCVGLFF